MKLKYSNFFYKKLFFPLLLFVPIALYPIKNNVTYNQNDTNIRTLNDNYTLAGNIKFTKPIQVATITQSLTATDSLNINFKKNNSAVSFNAKDTQGNCTPILTINKDGINIASGQLKVAGSTITSGGNTNILSPTSITTTGSTLIGTDLTIAGSETFGKLPQARIIGQGAIANITTSSATLLTINLTSRTAGVWVNLYVFGTDATASADILYKTNLFASTTSWYTLYNATSSPTATANNATIAAGISTSGNTLTVTIRNSAMSGNTLTNCYAFYEVMGNQLSSVVFNAA